MIAAPVTATADSISGTIRTPDGVPFTGTVEIACPPPVNVRLARPTDSAGRYAFYVHNTGRCMLKVHGASFPVYLSQNPVRYDLVYENDRLWRH